MQAISGRPTRSCALLAGFLTAASAFVGIPQLRGEADSTPPQLVSFDFTPNSADVTEAGREITVTTHLTDDNAGVTMVDVRFAAPSYLQQVAERFSVSDPVSGAAQDGIYTMKMAIPQGAEPGAWYLDEVFVYDAAGNVSRYGVRAEYARFPEGTPSVIDVADARPDLEIPQLVSLDLTPKHIDASENPQVVTVTARIADNFVGYRNGGFRFVSPSGAEEVRANIDAWHRVAGNAQDGVYTMTIAVPKGAELGTWTLNYVFLNDNATNHNDIGPYYRKEFGAGIATEFVAAPVVQTSATAYTVSESDFAAYVTVVREGDPSLSATVHLATNDGTAKATADFAPVSADVVFAAGETSKTVAVPLLHGESGGGDQDFRIALSSPRGAVLGTRAASVKLADASASPAIQWAANAYTAREGQGNVTLTLVRTGIATAAATVHYATKDSSARRAADYRRVSGDVTFVPNETTKTVAIPILQDRIDETTETFSVTLTNATGASLPRPSVRVKIVDDDPVPTVQWSSASFVANENGGYAILTAQLTGRKSTRVTVRYGTSDDTAQAGLDYSAVSGEITFSPGGPTSQSVRIAVVNDHLPEVSESFNVMLTGTASAMIGPQSVAAVTITE